MIGAFIVFLGAVSLVATYIFTVNRLLRSDENWSEGNRATPPAEAERTPFPEGEWAGAQGSVIALEA